MKTNTASGVTVRLNHVDKVCMNGWSKTARGEYTHETGRRVRRDSRGYWEVCGGPQDGSAWQTMHWAMYQAEKR
jgi:hypothetical protein